MKRPDDIVIAREILARQRRYGQPFGVAWSRVFQALPPADEQRRTPEGLEREQARRALLATREQWEQAYERRPPPDPDRREAVRSSS